MVGIIILCGVVLLLAVVLLIPAGVRFSYNQGDLALWVRYGPVRVQLYPRKKEEEEKEFPEPEKEKKKKVKPKKEKKPQAKINKEQILYSLEKLPPILGRALRRTGRRIHISPLKVHLLIACPDPADTALLYGKMEAALIAGLPVLHRLLRISEQDIRLFPDFAGEKMDAIAEVGVSVRPWDVLSIAVRAGGSLLIWLLGVTKLASPPVQEKKQSLKQEAASEAA